MPRPEKREVWVTHDGKEFATERLAENYEMALNVAAVLERNCSHAFQFSDLVFEVAQEICGQFWVREIPPRVSDA